MKTIVCVLNKDKSIDNFLVFERKLTKEELNDLRNVGFNYFKNFIFDLEIKLIKNTNIRFAYNQYIKLKSIEYKVKKEIFKRFNEEIKNPHYLK